MNKCELDVLFQQAIDTKRTYCPVCCHEFEVLAVDLICSRCRCITALDELITEWDDCYWDI